jgi:hypothetical protein
MLWGRVGVRERIAGGGDRWRDTVLLERRSPVIAQPAVAVSNQG